MATRMTRGSMQSIGWMLAILIAGVLWLPASRVSAQDGLATVSGDVWFDMNGNGQRDEHEGPLAQHPVTLSLSGEAQPGVLVVRVLTGEDGQFAFPNVEYGDYTLSAGTATVSKISVTLERSSASVSLGVAGQQVYLPMIGRW